jgi:hypothetical protein
MPLTEPGEVRREVTAQELSARFRDTTDYQEAMRTPAKAGCPLTQTLVLDGRNAAGVARRSGREVRSRAPDCDGLPRSRPFHTPGIRMGRNVMVVS